MGHSRKRKHKSSSNHSLEKLARKVEKLQRKIKRQRTLTNSDTSSRSSLNSTNIEHLEDTSSEKENAQVMSPNKQEIWSQHKEVQKAAGTNTDLPLVGEVECPPLDDNILKILGEDPTTSQAKAVELHPDLAARWKVWPVDYQKIQRNILGKYTRNGNCLLESPELIPEVLATFNDFAKKRDEHFRTEENLVGTALVAVGAAITQLISESEEGINEFAILELLSDAGKILTELYHALSEVRKRYILPSLDKNMRETLQETDFLLFGEKLGDKIRDIKAREKELGKN